MTIGSSTPAGRSAVAIRLRAAPPAERSRKGRPVRSKFAIVLAFGLLTAVVAAVPSSRSVAQDATPLQSTPEPGSAGLGFDISPIAFGPVEAVPSPPLVLGMIRVTLAPGANQDVGADPGPTLTYVESGSFSIRLDGPATVTRAATGGVPEAVSAGTDVTLTAGDAILVPGDTPNSARNEGTEAAVLLVALLLPAEALGPPPGGSSAGTPAP